MSKNPIGPGYNFMACPWCRCPGKDLSMDRIFPPAAPGQQENSLVGWWYAVRCHQCGCQGPLGPSTTEAFELWNQPRRATEQQR